MHPRIDDAGLWRASEAIVTSYLHGRGSTPDAVREAITVHRPGWWVVDTGHAVWTFGAATTQLRDQPGGLLRDLTDLQCLAGSPWSDPYAVLGAVYGLTQGYHPHHRGHRQLAEFASSRPVDVSSCAAFSRWATDFHNDINRRRGLKPLTYAQANAVRPLGVYATDSGGGIGDTVVGLYAACGLAKATGRRVIYYARWREWITRASFPGVEVRDYRPIGVDASGGWHGPHGYNKATQAAPSRLWAYCANLAAAYGLPAFEGVRPTVNRRIHRPRAEGRYAVLAPFTSAWPAREWPAAKWTELANALAAQGIDPIGVGTHDQRDRLAATLPGTAYRYGCSTGEITDLMLGAVVTIANDSGIAHVGGLLDVPTVAVHAGSLPHEYLFACAPSVRSVTAGRLPRSDANIDALRTIPAEQVGAAAFAIKAKMINRALRG